MTWHPENDTITFRQIREWHFVPEKSSGSEDDRVVALNVLGAVSESIRCNFGCVKSVFISYYSIFLITFLFLHSRQ